MLRVKPVAESKPSDRPEAESKGLREPKSRWIQPVHREIPSPLAGHSFHETLPGKVARAIGITLRRGARHACLGTPNLVAANFTNSRIRRASACATLRP